MNEKDRSRPKDIRMYGIIVLTLIALSQQAESCDGGGNGGDGEYWKGTTGEEYIFGFRGNDADAAYCKSLGKGYTFLVEELGREGEPIYAAVCASPETLPQGCETTFLETKKIVVCDDGK